MLFSGLPHDPARRLCGKPTVQACTIDRKWSEFERVNKIEDMPLSAEEVAAELSKEYHVSDIGLSRSLLGNGTVRCDTFALSRI